MLTRGVLRKCVDPTGDKPVILRVSGGNSIVGDDLSHEGITTSIEEAIRLDVSGVALSIYVGAKYEHQTLMSLSQLVNEGEKYGIPVLAVTAVGKELAKRDARYLSLSCRIAAELGAHMVKTYYCEEFEKVTGTCPIPVVIAGGPKLKTEMDVFNLAYNAIQQGAAGVDMGRNIWQNGASPIGMIKAIHHIVHGKGTPKEAFEIFESQSKEKVKV
jgi:putative autoinducer-2 (AI-2) aldolase